MIARSRAQIRVARRWTDYLETLQDGTAKEVGERNPLPPNRTNEVLQVLQRGQMAAADALLDEIWTQDAGAWTRRLAPFLRRLSPSGAMAFGRLVKSGCQPDALALRFWEAADPQSDAPPLLKTIRTEVKTLESVIDETLRALRAWRDRGAQLADLLSRNRLSVPEDEPGGAELKVTVHDLEQIAERQLADLERLRKQCDERRNPIVGHARVRLSLRVHEVTGRYNDAAIVTVIGDLAGDGTLDAAALRQQRARWTQDFRTKTRAGPATR